MLSKESLIFKGALCRCRPARRAVRPMGVLPALRDVLSDLDASGAVRVEGNGRSTAYRLARR